MPAIAAVIAPIPFPFTMPVNVVAPVPPLATGKFPVTLVARLVVDELAAIPYPCPTFQ